MPRVARDAEISDWRLAAAIELVTRNGDRAQKGRRLWTPAFRIADGSRIFATVMFILAFNAHGKADVCRKVAGNSVVFLRSQVDRNNVLGTEFDLSHGRR